MQWETARLVIDALQRSDAETLLRYRADPEVSRYQGWRPASLDDALRFIDACGTAKLDTPDRWFQRAIRRRDSAELIGDLGLHFVADVEATVELGISLSPRHQGQGFAGEALCAVLDFVFDNLGKHRVFGSVDPRNHASVKLLESVGLRKEAHFRQSLRIDSEWVDDAIYAMLECEWSARRAVQRQRG